MELPGPRQLQAAFLYQERNGKGIHFNGKQTRSPHEAAELLLSPPPLFRHVQRTELRILPSEFCAWHKLRNSDRVVQWLSQILRHFLLLLKSGVECNAPLKIQVSKEAVKASDLDGFESGWDKTMEERRGLSMATALLL